MFMNNTNEAWASAICSLFSSIYIPVLITYVNYSGNLYNMGKYSAVYFVVILFIAECCKILYLFSKNGSSIDIINSKSVNTRKMNYAIPQFKIREAIRLIIGVPVSVLMYMCGIFMFGAPVTSQHEETMMLGLLLTVLTTFPLFFYTGVDNTIRVLSGQKPYFGEYVMEMLVQNVILTIFGTWGGAILIPLDWDCPWQVWPLPCVYGALLGYVLACFVTVVRMIPHVARWITFRA